MDSLSRLSGLARYRFVTIAWFGTCAMRKGEVLFVRLGQESSFSPPVDHRHQCAHDQHHHGNRNPEPWGSFFGSDSGVTVAASGVAPVFEGALSVGRGMAASAMGVAGSAGGAAAAAVARL